MKIYISSDIHLEFEDININNEDNADVLILAGDIMVAHDLHEHPHPIDTSSRLGSRQLAAIRYRNFLSRVSQEFPHVIYIAGNHEFYHGTWEETHDILRNECSRFSNVYFIEKEDKIINDVVFVGSTLWTDLNNGDPLALYNANQVMNDFRIIRKKNLGYTKLKPADTVAANRKSIEYFQNILNAKPQLPHVVITHHTPTFLSCSPAYLHDRVTNYCYHNSLGEFILSHPQIKLWVCGHTHYKHRYYVGDTLVTCNPRGYHGYEDTALNYKPVCIDLNNMPKTFDNVETTF
jgi:predicted phosphodiesterase